MPSRLLIKLYLGYVLIIAVATIITWQLLERQLTSDSQELVRSDLAEETLVLAEILHAAWLAESSSQDRPLAGLQERLERIADVLTERYTIVAADGRVLIDSDRDPMTMDNHADRPELRASLATREVASSVRFSDTLHQPMMYVARAVFDAEHGHHGWVRASVPVEALSSRRDQLRLMVTIGVAGAALTALALGLIMARQLIRPLDQLTRAAQGLAEGDLSVTLPVAGRDEIGDLVRSFASMAQQLEQRIRTISNDRSKLLTILSDMHEGLIAVDADERLLHINAVAKDLLQVTSDAVIGQPLWQVITHQAICSEILASMRSNCDRSNTMILDRRTPRYLQLHVSPLHDEEQTVTGAVLVLTDHTDRQRVDDMRRDFVANVSHELKTPLTVIQGIIETVIEDADMPLDMRQRFLGKARAHSLRLGNLVNDLLVLSRLESQEQSIERERLDLAGILRGACSAIQEVAEQAEIAIEDSGLNEAMWVRGDSEGLRQVVDNLLSNAIRYSPPKTRVRLRAWAAGSWWCFSVSDEGIGIPATAQKRIFERFYRVDKARSRALGGTGLGLAIVRHFVLAHGGRISVESEIGQGSVFTVQLPLAAS